MMSFIYTDSGKLTYAEGLERQTEAFEALLDAKRNGTEGQNRLFFCEHLPVLTIGKNGRDTNLLVSEAFLLHRGISLFHANRGGDITYHGPGQITGYPVFDLEYWQMGLKQYVHTLEELIIRFLALYGIKAGRLEGAAGVWIDAQLPAGARKICAIGIKSSRYVTMHGFALNINTDLSCFSLINPCGFTDKGVTSLERELGAPQDFEHAKALLLGLFREFFPLRVA
ncbi:MAG: lipoyl(octanoyl) transferase LipB [Tannerellaceae bacterium]|jgi:lipoyl(octanoyl) transferase|nr:lipoyl(octanoyl) transferase LipB [Tannerellaceae bacterium]